VAFSPDGKTLVSAGRDDGVKLWPLRPPEKEDVLPGTWQPLAISKDGRTLAALNRAGTNVAFVNLVTRELEWQFPLDASRFRDFRLSSGTVMSSVSISEDLKTLAQILDNGSVKIWNVETREFTTLKVADRPLELIVLSPDGGALITGERGRNLRGWDLRSATNAVLATDAHRVVFSRDGQTLATFQRGNNKIQLWSVATRSLRTNLVVEAQFGFEPAAAFSRDGSTLAVACADDTIRLLDVATGRLLGTCTGHKQNIPSVALSPDGKTLASASDDSTLKLWNVATQQELLTIRKLGGALRGLIFSLDGSLLVGGGSFSLQSGGLRFYPAPFNETEAANVRRGLEN